MAILFWCCVGIVLYTYAGYPLLISSLARISPQPWKRATWAGGEPPISVLMAVHNGAAMVQAQLEHLLQLDPARVAEVIIVSDGSTDTTADVLLRHQETAPDPRLHIIVLPEQGGKTAALNQALLRARSEILLFIDIRPRVEPGAIESLLENFADPAVGCVAGELLLASDGLHATAGAVSGLYWRYEQWIRVCEAAVDSPVGVYGGFYAVRRALATPAPAGLILDDMFQPLSIIRQGYRSVLDRNACVRDRWPASTAGEFQRKVRTLAGNFQLVRQAPWILTCRVAFQLISHKLLRLVVPWCFLLMVGTSVLLGIHSMSYAVTAALQLVFWTLALLSLRFRIPLLGRLGVPASALLVLNAAAVAALWKYMTTRGPLWKIWFPPNTADGRLANR